MLNKEILRLEAIGASYNSKEILCQLELSLKSGSMTALLGANGAGKTTLLKVISQRLPHKGFCHMEDVTLEQLSVRERAKRISYIPQRSSLSISLPIIDVVLMGFNPQLKLLEFPSAQQRRQALTALKAVGLEDAAEDDYQTLSEGQKQLVYLARTLTENAKLLLLDEPDSALDFQNRYHILQKIKELVQTEDKAALLCLHDPQLALEFCDHVVLLKDGRILAELYPQNDALSEMEEALRQIYGEVELAEHIDRHGKRHLVLLWEGSSCIH